MINTHILAQEFEYLEPKTIEEAIQYLAKHGKKAKVIAGGTDLLVKMKMEEIHPEVLINISRIPSLRYLVEERGLRIGSLTSFREVERSQVIKEKYTALFEAAQSVSSVQIKNMGTIGGNLCHASPAADSAPPLIALGAKVKLVERNRVRILALEEFFAGAGQTVLSPMELMVEIQVPGLPERTGSSFLKIGRVSADIAKVNVAVAIVRQGDICQDCRIALGAVAERPIRLLKVEELMIGERLTQSLVEEVSRKSSEETRPITDVRSTDWYRREVCKVLVRNAISVAWRRAGA
jgi:carbon-monoxide dehydrogenase medium subunit